MLDENNYSEKEIAQVIQAYEQSDSNTYEWNSLECLDICDQLFWAYVSGSEYAKLLLLEAEKKYGGFDGHAAEEYYSLLETMKNIEEFKRK